MTNEERDLITQFITRVGGTPAHTGSFAGAVPATAAAMPPVDRDADMLIGNLLGQYPEARYRLTQLAVVQEQALTQAQTRINQLQAELQQARQAAPPSGPSPWGAAAGAAPQPPGQQPGFLGRLFGGGAAQPQPQYQQPQYAPQPQYAQPAMGGGMFQRGGSGFLGSALTTAAGVAGGMVAGNALMNMFSGHHDSSTFGNEGGGFGGGGYGQPGYADQGGGWGGGQAGADPYDVGGAPKDQPTESYADQSAPADSGWTDSGSSDSGGGWTDSSSGSDSF